MMISSRTATDAGFVEMLLFLHRNIHVVSLDVPELKDREEMDEKISCRNISLNPGLDIHKGPFQPLDLMDHERKAWVELDVPHDGEEYNACGLSTLDVGCGACNETCSVCSGLIRAPRLQSLC